MTLGHPWVHLYLWSICGVSFRAISPVITLWYMYFHVCMRQELQDINNQERNNIPLSYLHSPAPSSPLQPVPDQCEWDLLNPIPLQWLGLHRVHRTGSCTPSSPKWLLSPQWHLSQWTVSRWLTHQHSCYCQKREKHIISSTWSDISWLFSNIK